MRIRDVLRVKGTQVVTVTPDTRVRRLLAVLAEHGTERPIPSETHVRNSPPIGDEFRTPVSDSPVVRLVDQQLVREAFARCTPEDPRQTFHYRF